MSCLFARVSCVTELKFTLRLLTRQSRKRLLMPKDGHSSRASRDCVNNSWVPHQVGGSGLTDPPPRPHGHTKI